MATEQQLTPEVLWAQRSSNSDPDKNFIYLTISVPDVPKESMKLDVKDQGLVFTGRSDTLKKTYHLELEFYAPIDVEKSKQNVHHTGMHIVMKLIKKELKEEYWPRLLKEAKRMHFLKTDFDKWVDEDEQDEKAEEDFSQFGGMGGMPGMGGMGGMGGGDFGGLDFSKLGGAGGEVPEDDEDEDDEDMPPLEGEEEEGKDKAKPADKA